MNGELKPAGASRTPVQTMLIFSVFRGKSEPLSRLSALRPPPMRANADGMTVVSPLYRLKSLTDCAVPFRRATQSLCAFTSAFSTAFASSSEGLYDARFPMPARILIALLTRFTAKRLKASARSAARFALSASVGAALEFCFVAIVFGLHFYIPYYR